MTFLRHALRSLPEDLCDQVKSRAGADSLHVNTTSTSTAASSPSVVGGIGGDGDSFSSTTEIAASAVSAVTAAAGHLVGGVLGRKALSAEGGRGGLGLVRELVERCLFSPPQERGYPYLSEDEEEGEDLIGDSGDEVRTKIKQYT